MFDRPAAPSPFMAGQKPGTASNPWCRAFRFSVRRALG